MIIFCFLTHPRACAFTAKSVKLADLRNELFFPVGWEVSPLASSLGGEGRGSEVTLLAMALHGQRALTALPRVPPFADWPEHY